MKNSIKQIATNIFSLRQGRAMVGLLALIMMAMSPMKIWAQEEGVLLSISIDLYGQDGRVIKAGIYNQGTAYIYDADGQKQNSYGGEGGEFNFAAVEKVYGFSFAGWYKDNEFVTTDKTFTDNVTTDGYFCYVARYVADANTAIPNNPSYVSLNADISGNGEASFELEGYPGGSVVLVETGTTVKAVATTTSTTEYDNYMYGNAYDSNGERKEYDTEESSLEFEVVGNTNLWADFSTVEEGEGEGSFTEDAEGTELTTSTEGNKVNITGDKNGFVMYHFTPSTTGTYRFRSVGDLNLDFIEMWLGEEQITLNGEQNDPNATNSLDFNVTAELTAENTYDVYIFNMSSTNAVNYPVYITYEGNNGGSGSGGDDNYSTLNTSPFDIAVMADGEEDATVDVKNTTAAVIEYEDGSTTLKCYDETGVMDYAELAHAVKYNITLSGVGIGAPDDDDEPTIDGNGTVWAGAPRRHAMAKAPGQLPTGAALVLESNRSSHHYMAADGPISLYLKDGKYVVNGEDEFKASSITSIYYFDPHQLDEDGCCTVGGCDYENLELTLGKNTVSFPDDYGWKYFTFTPTETSNYVISCEGNRYMDFEERIQGSDGNLAPCARDDSQLEGQEGFYILASLEEGVTYKLEIYGSGSETINIATTEETFTPKYRINAYAKLYLPAEDEEEYGAFMSDVCSTAVAYFTCDEETERNTDAYRSFSSITLHAVEVDGCTFKGWYVNGDQISTDYEYTIESIDRSNDYKAYYVLDSDQASGYSVVAVECEGNGTAKFSYGEGESAVEGTVALVPNDTEVTFTATAGENASFVKWSVDDGTCRYEEDNPLTLTITDHASVKAIFESTISLSSGENTVDIPANNVVYCKFKPTESGVYNIYSEGNLDLDIDGNISSDDEEESVNVLCDYNDYDGDYSDFSYTVLLNAGVTYTIPVLNNSNTDAEDYTICIATPEALTSKVTIPGGSSKIYSFTPQATADYRFYSEGEDADLDCYIYDSEGQTVDYEGSNDDSNADNEDDFNITASLTGGKTYYIKIVNCDDNNDVEDYSVNVEKVALELPTLTEGEDPNLLNAEDEGYISYSFTPATTGTYRFYMEGIDDILYWEGIFDAESGEKVGDAVKWSDDYEELSILTSLVKDKEYIVKLYFNDYTEDIELYINPTTDVFVPLYNISAEYALYDSKGKEKIRGGNNQVAYLTLNSKSNSYFYEPGGNATFTATDRVYGFTFQGWYDEDGEILTSEHTYSTTISSDFRICAHYKVNDSFDIAEEFSLVSVDVDNPGTGNVSACIEEYSNAALALLPRGTQITLKATEADGSKFDYWIYYIGERENEYNSSSITLTANGWVCAYACFIKELSEFTLTDGVKYDREDKAYVEEFTYERTVSNEQVNKWQALYVPFQMSYDDWKDKFEVATIQNFHEYTDENGEITDMELEVRLVKNGKIKANRPYLIMPKEAGDITIELSNVTLAKAENKSVSCSSVEKTYTFTGTYELLQEMKTNNYLFMSGGALRSATDDDQTLKAQRWYLTIKNTDSSVETDEVVESAAAKGINILVLDDDETAIDDIMVETTPMSSTNAKAGIYDLQGRRQESLGKGINIIRHTDGTFKRVMVK